MLDSYQFCLRGKFLNRRILPRVWVILAHFGECWEHFYWGSHATAFCGVGLCCSDSRSRKGWRHSGDCALCWLLEGFREPWHCRHSLFVGIVLVLDTCTHLCGWTHVVGSKSQANFKKTLKFRPWLQFNFLKEDGKQVESTWYLMKKVLPGEAARNFVKNRKIYKGWGS